MTDRETERPPAEKPQGRPDIPGQNMGWGVRPAAPAESRPPAESGGGKRGQ